jgi:hypothetical protein
VYVRLFAEEATPVLKREFRNDRCLNSTRICLEVMKAFNVSAYPMSVTTLALNKEWRDISAKLGRFPTEEEWSGTNAWAVGLDAREDPSDIERNAWAGHLIAIVQKEWLVDASAIQISRPEKKMSIPDVFVGWVPKWFPKGRSSMTFESEEGAHLVYRARPDDRSWATLDGFQKSPWNMQVALEIAGRMAKRMGRKEQPCLR